MSKSYKVIEKLTIQVAHYVQADDEDQARDLVSGLGAEEYDEFIFCEESEIESVEELGRTVEDGVNAKMRDLGTALRASSKAPPDYVTVTQDREGLSERLRDHFAYSGDDPDNVIVLEMEAWRKGTLMPVDSLSEISFFKDGGDWKMGKFRRVSELEGCPHLQEIARDMGLPE